MRLRLPNPNPPCCCSPAPTAFCRRTNIQLRAIRRFPSFAEARSSSISSRSPKLNNLFQERPGSASIHSASASSTRNPAHRSFAVMASATSFFDFKVKDSKLHPNHAPETHSLACSSPRPTAMTTRQLAGLALPALRGSDGDAVVRQRLLDDLPSPSTLRLIFLSLHHPTCPSRPSIPSQASAP